MWPIWTGGFVSIVEKPEDRKRDTLTVRARDRKSLANFLVLARGGDADEIAASLELNIATDYPFREVLRRDDVAYAVSQIVRDLDYSNFKDAAAARGVSNAFLSYLHRVWTAGLVLETKATRRAVNKVFKRREARSTALEAHAAAHGATTFGVDDTDSWLEFVAKRD